MLHLHFEGWFQCRLATNPDPTDEPRGVSGYTFALAGEPDLDRVIRFHDPVAPRTHGPEVGVHVTRVFTDGAPAPRHPLVGARVALVGAPRFESRNLLLTEDRAGVGLIHPFHLEIDGGGTTLRRPDLLDPEQPDRPLHRHAPGALRRRAPTTLDGMTPDPVRIAAATGISDAAAHRRRRRDRLAADLRREDDALRRAALEKRLDELSIDDPRDMRLLALGLTQARAFDLNGPAEMAGADVRADAARPWPVEFWMGGWDADALCGYVGGMLGLPQRADGA